MSLKGTLTVFYLDGCLLGYGLLSTACFYFPVVSKIFHIHPKLRCWKFQEKEWFKSFEEKETEIARGIGLGESSSQKTLHSMGMDIFLEQDICNNYLL